MSCVQPPNAENVSTMVGDAWSCRSGDGIENRGVGRGLTGGCDGHVRQDSGVTYLRVWISDALTGDVVLGTQGPGTEWIEVGTIDTSQETELRDCLRKLKEGRASRPGDGFYLHADPGSSWLRRAQTVPNGELTFWLAIDLSGNGERYAVTAHRARVGGPSRRRPTRSHPGLVQQATTIGISVIRRKNAVFKYIRP